MWGCYLHLSADQGLCHQEFADDNLLCVGYGPVALGRSRSSLDNFLVLQVEGTLYWQRCFAFWICVDCFSCGEFQMVLLGCYLVSDFINLTWQKWCVCLPNKETWKKLHQNLDVFHVSKDYACALFGFYLPPNGGIHLPCKGHSQILSLCWQFLGIPWHTWHDSTQWLWESSQRYSLSHNW